MGIRNFVARYKRPINWGAELCVIAIDRDIERFWDRQERLV